MKACWVLFIYNNALVAGVFYAKTHPLIMLIETILPFSDIPLMREELFLTVPHRKLPGSLTLVNLVFLHLYNKRLTKVSEKALMAEGIFSSHSCCSCGPGDSCERQP